MGKLVIFTWYYICLWSNEPEHEKDHVHIYRRKSKQAFGAKFNLETLKFVNQGDFTSKEIKRINNDIIENLDMIKDQVEK